MCFDWLAIVSFLLPFASSKTYSLTFVIYFCIVSEADYFPPCLDKSVGGCGYVEDHQSPVEFMKNDSVGIGKMAPSTAQAAH